MPNTVRPLRFLKGDAALATVKKTRWDYEVAIGYIRYTASGHQYHYVIRRMSYTELHEAVARAKAVLKEMPGEEPVRE